LDALPELPCHDRQERRLQSHGVQVGDYLDCDPASNCSVSAEVVSVNELELCVHLIIELTD
jgi:hypothetical protein